MDQCFRHALWMLLLIGFLQAKPVCVGQSDMGFCYLLQDVNCVNVTFKSTNVTETCLNAILKHFKEGFNHARQHCKDDQQRIGNTLEALDGLHLTQADSSGCKLETKETQFENFVNDTKTFVELLNARPRK